MSFSGRSFLPVFLIFFIILEFSLGSVPFINAKMPLGKLPEKSMLVPGNDLVRIATPSPLLLKSMKSHLKNFPFFNSNGKQINVAYAYNWAGYVIATSFNSPEPAVNQINASWIVQPANPTPYNAYSSQWLGIGGFFDSTLIQTGTSSDFVSNSPQYGAWVELLPAAETPLNSTKYPVKANDLMFGELKLVNPTTGNWLVELEDISESWTYKQYLIYNSINGGPSSLLSGEYIDERPTFCFLYSCQLANLTNFGTASYGYYYTHIPQTNYATVNGIYASLGKLPYNLTIMFMLNQNGTSILAQPQPISSNGTSFQVAYENNFSVIASTNTPVVDSGQSIYLEAKVTGGTGSNTYQWYNCTSTTCEKMASYTSNVIYFVSNSLGTFKYRVVANDSTGASSTSSNISVLVNKPLSKAAMVFPASTNTLYEGQPIQLVANVLGGTPPYTYNFLISQQGNPSNVIVSFAETNSLTTNSIVWTTNAIGTFVANMIVTDAFGESANSVYSANIAVNRAPSLNLSILNTSNYTYYMDVPVDLEARVPANTGFGPYTVTISLANSIIASNIIQIGQNSVAFSLIPQHTGKIAFNGMATDKGTTYPYVFFGTSRNITVLPILKKYISLSANTANSIYFFNANAMLSISAANTVSGNVLIANVTPSYSNLKPTKTDYLANVVVVLNISSNVTNANAISEHLLVPYPCSYAQTNVAPYLLTNGAWSPIPSSAYSVNTLSCTFNVTVPVDPIIGIFGFIYSPPTTTVPSSSSSSGAAGGGGGGGGNFKPTVVPFNTSTEVGVIIYNFSQDNQEYVKIENHTIYVVENFISVNESGVSINGTAYDIPENRTIEINVPMPLYVTLVNISYLPILHTITLKLYATRSVVTSTTTTSSTTTVPPTTIRSTTLSTTITYVKTTVPALPQKQSANKTKIIGIILSALVILVAIYLYFKSRSKRAAGGSQGSMGGPQGPISASQGSTTNSQTVSSGPQGPTNEPQNPISEPSNPASEPPGSPSEPQGPASASQNTTK